jgi:hypothetical protein
MSEYTGNSQIANRPWVWGNDSISTFKSSNDVMISQLDAPKVTSNISSVPSPVQPVPIQVGTYITIVNGVVTYVGNTPPTTTTTTTPGPTTSTTTSSTTTSSTTTSTSSTTTTTPPPGYAYSGVDCNGSAVTIYTANPTFSSSDPAFEDNRLTTSFSGYFVYGGITYLYTNGIAVISNCPATTSTTTTSSTTTTPPPPTTTTPPP